MSAHESQFFDWLPWTSENLDNVPKDEKSWLEMLANKRSFTPDKTTSECLKKNGMAIKHRMPNMSKALKFANTGNNLQRTK
ncbi:hypothetical protein MNBD_BACTEROID03-588 [hydrothermal vent metagenome]|uniref:Uncharacterized protein n=1 Tax=hydrothermal vent metagenome TaxID=652676 RepID=A0A3B0T2M0_9ZZZZ